MEIENVILGSLEDEIFKINNMVIIDSDIIPDVSYERYYNFSNPKEFTADFTADFSADFQRIADLINPSNNPDFHMEALVDRIQKRKHKKRRINKKWAKRYGYWDVVLRGRVNPDMSMENPEDKDVRWHGTIDNVEVVVR